MHNRKYKLSKPEQNHLFIRLAKALAALNNPEESAQFLRDLLSEVEVLMLARRLQIAELLIDGMTYDQIRAAMKVGPGTIAKVQTWLELYGDGYRTVIERCNKKNISSKEISKPFDKLKRKYPVYFWPELLLDEIVMTANKRQKQKLLNVATQLKDKTHLSKELNKLLKN